MTSYYRTLLFLLTGLLVFGGTLGSCQRASYVFQPPASVPAPAAGPPAVVLGALLPEAAPAPPAVESIRWRATRHSAERQRLAAPATHRAGRPSYRAATSRPVLRARREVAHRVTTVPPRWAAVESPASAPANKWVAVGLAVLLGFLGAHLFYLGYRRLALRYLLITLLSAGLILLLLALLPTASLGAGLATIFLVCVAAGSICLVYVWALLDALRILIGGVDNVG